MGAGEFMATRVLLANRALMPCTVQLPESWAVPWGLNGTRYGADGETWMRPVNHVRSAT